MCPWSDFGFARRRDFSGHCIDSKYQRGMVEGQSTYNAMRRDYLKLMDDFDWQPLGKDWWLEAAKSCGADERQMKFACCKFKNKSHTESARRSGYGEDGEAAKQAGYRLSRTRVVSTLLALASAECRGGPDGTVDSKEARVILSGLARSSDPSIRIRACEAIQRMDNAEREFAGSLENDGLSDCRAARDILLTPAHLRPEYAAGFVLSLVPMAMSRWPMLHDLAPVVRESWPEVWGRLLERQSPSMRNELERFLADPGWQLKVRKEVWGEVNYEIQADGVPRPVAKHRRLAKSAALPAPEAKANGSSPGDSVDATQKHGGIVLDDRNKTSKELPQ